DLARSFTLFQWALSQLQPGLDLESEDRITVLAFDDEASFAPYKLRREEETVKDTKSVIGQFFGHPEAPYILLNAFPPGRQSSLPTVYHEYVHFFVNENLGRVPLWFNEGLAVYYSSFEIRRSRLELGLPPEDFLTWSRQRSFWPFERLFAEDGTSSDFLDPESRTTFYAQSWALVHYLLTGDQERSRRAGVFLSALDRGTPPTQAWQAAFGEPLDGLEKTLRGYVNQPSFPYKTLPITRDNQPERPEVRKLPAEEAREALEHFLELSGRGEGASSPDAEPSTGHSTAKTSASPIWIDMSTPKPRSGRTHPLHGAMT
ncbi:MAG: DUF1570 domain-containing protein, partial [Gemmatimonadota bacterium]